MSMIAERLLKEYLNGKLYNSYLIQTDDIAKAEQEVLKFLASTKMNPEITKVDKPEPSSKNITVDQIRKLQGFINSTSVISSFKVAIIIEAELMNLNAANACLKILEDNPVNSYIFLITTKQERIIPTLRSRCAKIFCNFHILEQFEIDESYIKPLLHSTALSEKLDFIDKISKKDKLAWQELSRNIELLFSNLAKALSSIPTELTPTEAEILDQLQRPRLSNLLNKHKVVTTLLKDTNKLDLDIKNSTLLIVNSF